MASASPQPGPASDRQKFLVEVAYLRHEHGLDQQTIAERFAVSRSTISRALSDAQRLGIVQVVITRPTPREARLTDRLRDRYAIAAHVASRLDGEASLEAAARGTARLVERIAAAGQATIAASWGRTLARAAQHVRRRQAADIAIVDAIGHARGEQMAAAIDVTNALAAVFGTSVVHMGAPAFAGSQAALEFLLASPPVERALRLARSADVMLVSVGVAGEASLLRQEGLMTAGAMADLIRRGAVGEILGRYFDAGGRAVETPWLHPVGLSLDDLRQGRRVIAAAGSAGKAESVRAAIAGGIIDEVVVDDQLAEALLVEPNA
jgi:deoxyribonucleoside regulator